jgi:nitrogen regulatory protein PII
MSFHLITCVVNKNRAKKVIDASLRAGAQAVTSLDMKGQGPVRQPGKAAHAAATARKTIFIVTNSEATFIVFDEIVAVAQLKEPGNGFAFIQEVDKTIGFFDGMYKGRE